MRLLRTAVTLAVLTMTAGGASAQTMSDVPFACSDGRTIIVEFAGETANVTMSMSLTARETGSGFLYGGDAGELRGQGDEIMWSGGDTVTCQAVPGGAALVGGTWELVQRRTESGSVDTEDPARHSVTFLADGTLALRADCNPGRGTWSAMPDGRASGALTLGPVALTRMACAADPFPQMAGDLDGAMSYGVEDGTLQIETQGGAIYLFRAATE